MGLGGSAYQEQPNRAAGGADSGDRLDRHVPGEVGEPTARLLLDTGRAIGVVVDDEGLASGSEGGELTQVGMLGRLGAVRGDAVQVGPDAVVGIGEDEVTAGGRCQ